MKSGYNKHVEEYIDQQTKKACLAGSFPQVEFKGSAEGRGFSMSLFDFVEVNGKFDRCYHEELKKAGIEAGIFTKKRIQTLLPLLEELSLKIIAAGSNDLAVGQKILMRPIREISNQPRVATVAETIYLDGIFDISVSSQNGYSEETGSAYVWEIQVVEVGGVWRPFDMTKEEREFQKQVEGR